MLCFSLVKPPRGTFLKSLRRALREEKAPKKEALQYVMAKKQLPLVRQKDPNTVMECHQRLGQFRQLVETLELANEQLRERLERLEANSTNSSTPPSQDRLSGKAKKEHHRKPSEKKRGVRKCVMKSVLTFAV